MNVGADMWKWTKMNEKKRVYFDQERQNDYGALASNVF